jgi:hypothetical protein
MPSAERQRKPGPFAARDARLRDCAHGLRCASGSSMRPAQTLCSSPAQTANYDAFAILYSCMAALVAEMSARTLSATSCILNCQLALLRLKLDMQFAPQITWSPHYVSVEDNMWCKQAHHIHGTSLVCVCAKRSMLTKMKQITATERRMMVCGCTRHGPSSSG